MNAQVTYERQGRIGLITIDNPPVNAFSHAVRAGIIERLREARNDAAAEAIVLTSHGKAFSGGADIREFGKPRQSPTLQEVIEALEEMPKIVVAGLHGTTVGGGLETALGCHYRCAPPNAKVGLPEVNLGLIPGAGGTQRVPRLTGIPAAADFILSGSPVAAAKAQELGLIDALIGEDVIADAVAYAERLVDEGAPLRRVRDIAMNPAAVQDDAFEKARAEWSRKRRGYANTECVFKSLEAAATQPFEDGLKRERAFFQELENSPQSEALRYVFFGERAVANVPGITKETPRRTVETVAILGAGTMGTGIAMAFVNAGVPVTVFDTEREALDRGMKTIEKTYRASVDKGRMDADAMQARMNRVTPVNDYDALADADLIIEAVFEDMAIKKDVFGKLDSIAKPGAILASNTSSLDLNVIAATTSRPENVVGLHFFSPANVMRLLEIVRAERTSDEVLATALDTAKRIGKVGVVSGVCFGFIGNRMRDGYVRESNALLLEGASPAEVDKALYDFGFAMGPFQVNDVIGNDVSYRIRQERRAAGTLPADEQFCAVADRITEAGRLGQKTGKGFYDYEEGSRQPIPSDEVAAIIDAERERFGITPRKIDADEILARCIYPLINEGARIIEEGIAYRPVDVDMVWIFGYGFPRYRGGPMKFADQTGLPQVLERIREFARQHGEEYWTPAPLLERLVSEGRKFADLEAAD